MRLNNYPISLTYAYHLRLTKSFVVHLLYICCTSRPRSWECSSTRACIFSHSQALGRESSSGEEPHKNIYLPTNAAYVQVRIYKCGAVNASFAKSRGKRMLHSACPVPSVAMLFYLVVGCRHQMSETKGHLYDSGPRKVKFFDHFAADVAHADLSRGNQHRL